MVSAARQGAVSTPIPRDLAITPFYPGG
jgi:hypothetical protein